MRLQVLLAEGRIAAHEVFEFDDKLGAAGRTKINRRAGCNRLGIGSAARMATLGALRERQHLFDTICQRVAVLGYLSL